MRAGKSARNQGLSPESVTGLPLSVSGARRMGEAAWATSSRKQTCGRLSRTAASSSARLSLRAAKKNSSFTCAAIGYAGEGSASFGPGAACPAIEPSRIWNRHGSSLESSTSWATLQSIPPAIPTFANLLASRREIFARWAMTLRQRRLKGWLRPANPDQRPSRASAFLVAAAIALPGLAHADALSVRAFGQLALRCGASVAPSTLAALARTESSFQPLAINDDTTRTRRVPATRDIAVQIASKLLESGHSVDIGLMQIYAQNFASLGLTLETAFDPCRSIAAAAAILAGAYAGGDTHDAQQSALRVAISKYNTGDAQRGFVNGYVHKVELAAQHVVPAIDVGTPPAAIDSPASPTPAPAAPVDPNAPASWDVWSSYEYDDARHQDPASPAADARGTGSGGLADAEKEPTAAVLDLGSTVER